MGLGEDLSQCLLDLTQTLQGPLPAPLLFGRRQGRWDAWRRWRRRRRSQTNPTDLKVFLEPVELKQIAQFERADIAPLGMDLALQVGHYGS